MILDNLNNQFSDGSHKKVKIKCDSGKNKKCLGIFEREWRNVVKQRKRTKNNDYCRFCQKTEEYSGRNNPNTKYKYIDDNILNIIDTEMKAYVLGWIASDGSISKNSISISIRDYDVQTLKTIRDFFHSDLPIIEIKTNMVGLTINSKQIVEDVLRHLGLDKYGKKSDKVKFPILSEELYPLFIRGYFEGDGCINIKDRIPRCKITSNSLNMLEGIKNTTGLGNIYNKTIWEINSGLDTIKFMDYIYENQEIPKLERKYSTYLDIVNWRPALRGQYKGIDTSYGLIRVAKSHEKAIYPKILDNEASGLDLHIVDKVKDFSNDVSLYTTGLKIQPPTGYYFLLVARSSMSKTNFSLANGIGIIDKNYLGEIMVPLRKHDSLIEEPDLPLRIVQLIPMKVHPVDFMEVDSLEVLTNRGDSGFGEHTGRK